MSRRAGSSVHSVRCLCARALALACIASAWGCGGGAVVARVYDGHVVEGRAVPDAAYAAFLNGAILESAGDPHAALALYERAADLDGDSPEIWSRVGAVRCSIDPADKGADEAFARATRLDPGYAGAWAARARCAQARKDEATVASAARRASELDPSADGANALLARASGAVRDAAARDALVALTETARDRVAAWDALASWASSHGDVALWSRALVTLARIAPARRDAVAQAAEELAGAGEIAEAREVAAAAVEGGEGPFAEARHPLAARLAVDAAIGGGDAQAVRARATRARVALEEAGARAVLAGQKDLARSVVATLAAADPEATGARMVLAAAEGRDVLGAAFEVRHHGARASAAAFIAFGAAAARILSAPDLRATLAAVTHGPIVPGDDRAARPAVELVTRGVLDAGVLSPDAQVELAALRGGRGTGEALAFPDRRALDARHEYLAQALADPQGARARELGARLAPVVGSDPVVAAAAALIQIATGAPIDAAAPRALLMRDPHDPLLAATALRLATKTGDTAVAGQARESLGAF